MIVLADRVGQTSKRRSVEATLPDVVIYRNQRGEAVRHKAKAGLCAKTECCLLTLDGVLACESLDLVDLSAFVTVGRLNPAGPSRAPCPGSILDFKKEKA